MGLKNVYNEWEDKWYAFLDGLDKKIPVYKVIDPLDKIIPSFALVLAVIAVILIALLGGVILPALGGGNATITLKAVDDANNGPLSGVKLVVSFNGEKHPLSSDAQGNFGNLSIPKGIEVSFSASKTGFQAYSDSATFDADAIYTIRMISIAAPKTFLITLARSDGSSLTGTQVKVDFFCSNTAVPPPSSITTTQGYFRVVVPNNCGILTSRASADGFQISAGQPLSDNSVIKLQEVVPETGSLTVRIFDESKNRVTDPDFDVSYQESDGTPGDSVRTRAGEANFKIVPVGKISVSATDKSGKYSLAQPYTVLIEKGKEKKLDAVVTRNVRGRLTLDVVDIESHDRVPKADVRVLDSSGKIVNTTSTGNDGNTIKLGLTDLGSYSLQVAHKDYLAFSRDFNIDGLQDVNLLVELQKCKDSLHNCGILIITVRDEENKKVENATISLYDANTGFLSASLQPQATDANGIARFSGLEEGIYFAKAKKYPAEATSKNFSVDPKQENKQTIQITIGKSNVVVNVKDRDGKFIPNAKVEFRDDSGVDCPSGKCVIESDSNGRASIRLKADKKVYVAVSASNYVRWVSQLYQLSPNTDLTVNATLEKTILGSKPEISVAFFENSTSSKQVTELKAGKTYMARLELRIPTDLDGAKAGVHFRTGTKELVENDSLYIKNVNVPEASQLKGTSYNPPNHQSDDLQNLTNGNAKWVNLSWNKVSQGIYNIEVEVFVREQTLAGDALTFNYRAWTVKNSSYARDPEDSELGTAQSSASKEELYASAKTAVFYASTPNNCSESFCYSGEKVYDQTERVNLSSPYTLRASAPYTVSFVLTNNSNTRYNEGFIRIQNSENLGTTKTNILQIQNYSITNASAQTFSNLGFDDYRMPDINLGDFKKNTNISVQLGILPQLVENSTILVQAIASGQVVYEKELEFSVDSTNDLSLTISPNFFPAFISFDGNALVKDKDGFEVKEAQVKITKILSDASETVLSTQDSDKTGKVDFSISPSDNATIIRFEASKEGYTPAVVDKKIDVNIVKFDPNTVKASLDPKTVTEKDVSIEGTNQIAVPLTVTSSNISGTFKGFLDEDKMNNYLSQYKNSLSFSPGIPKDFIVKTALANGINISKSDTLNGSTLLQVSNADLTKDWQFTLPTQVQISPGGTPENACLTLSISDWSTTTLEDTASIEFEISNNCQVGGKDIAIQNLAAKLNWSSNVIGNVSVALTNGDNQSSQETLRDNDSVILFDEIEAGETLNGILSFVPNSGTAGEEAQFKITFSGTTPTSSGNSEVAANHSIDADILVANLQQCLQFSPDSSEGITIARGTESTEFSIDDTKCGNISLDIRFCQDSSSNANCRGGTSDGGIYLSTQTISNLKEDSKTITVERSNIGGAYDITVEARAPGKNWQKVLDYPVTVEPDSEQYFWLDRYSFLLLGKDAQDSATLTSDRVVEPVAVTADLCAWGEASDSGKLLGAGLGIAAAGAIVTTISLLVTTEIAGTAGIVFTTSLASAIPTLGAAGPIGIAIGVILIFLDLFGIFGDCHDETQTETLYDYVINLPGSGDSNGGTTNYLPPDAQSIVLDGTNDVSAAWDLEVTNYYDNSGTTQQDVGTVFTNNSGIAQNNPIFAIGEFSATEHIHGDEAHGGNAAVECDNGNFGTYWIGAADDQGACSPASDKTYTQKIHLKFKTQETSQQIPQTNFDTYACSSGNLLGVTGPGAKPQIKLNWNWSNQDGISKTQCDVNNANGVYCDATQFNIELVKKLKDLDSFLAENSYFAGVCPLSSDENAQKQTNDQTKTHTVGAATVGISSFSSLYDSGKITFNYTIANNGSKPTDINFDLNVYNSQFDGFSSVESVAGTPYHYNTILAGGVSKSGSVSFTLPADTYQAKFLLSGDGNVALDSYSDSITFVILETDTSLIDAGYNCSTLRQTTDLTGKPIIDYFVETVGENNVHWTAEVPNKQALNNLLKFDAYLMADGYSNDFKKDFTQYYTEINFADTLPDFSNKWKNYFDSNYLLYTQKYYSSNTLSSPGKYQVEIQGIFGDDWRFFASDSNATPVAVVGIVFYKLEDPKNNSPFYSLPLDGLVGIESGGTSFNRQGYGVKFVNENGVLYIDNQNNPLKTYTDSGSNATQTLNTQELSDLGALNSNISTRGDVLSVENDSGTFKLDWSPAFATPVLLKYSRSDTTSDPFSAFYTFTEDSVPKNVGNTLTYWDGAGNCLDYSGLPVIQQWAQTPDRAATSSDAVAAWQTSYAADWEKAEVSGDVYLRSIFYSNRNSTNSLQIDSPIESAQLNTPDAKGTVVGLNGISTMKHNRQGSGSSDTIYSVQDVFDLVDQNILCVTDNGVKSRYWWNPQTIFKQGATYNIHSITQGLEAGNSCIGYSN